MTQAEKLEALVRRAKDSGWIDGNAALQELKSQPGWSIGNGTPLVMAVLFNHDFARALFKHPEHGVAEENCVQHPGWQWHLQYAVISDDPIDYMYQVLIDIDFPMKEGVDYV